MKPAEYLAELNSQLTYLFEFARIINELDFAGANFNEFRGMQDAGWTTTLTAYEVFDELQSLGAKGSPLSLPEYRQTLCLYAQLSEAGGIYEGLLNLLGIVQLKPWNSWPFQDMVRVHSETRRVVGPNANAMFRQLSRTATSIGMPKLADLLSVTFNDDVRNGMFHADYIIRHDGLRLRRRNGGHAYRISHEEVRELITIGIGFFDIFRQMQQKAVESFKPAKRIIGRFSANPPMAWTVELTEEGRFGISGNSPGPETDAAYDKQQAINSYLDGRVLAFYSSSQESIETVRDLIAAYGFEPVFARLSVDEFDKLLIAIEEKDLWVEVEKGESCGILASPRGFIRWTTPNCIEKILPTVEELEIE